MGEDYLKEYDFKSVFLLPVNLYGPGDNFIAENAHVIQALIQRFIEDGKENKPKISVWGTGVATREFLYITDAAKGIVLATEKLVNSEILNLGSGIETSIKKLVEIIKELTHYKGEIVWDSSKPDGTLRRCVDISKAENLIGFRATISLYNGLKKSIDWFIADYQL